MSVDIKSVGFIQAKHSSNFLVVLDCKVLNNEDLMKYGVDGMDTMNLKYGVDGMNTIYLNTKIRRVGIFLPTRRRDQPK